VGRYRQRRPEPATLMRSALRSEDPITAAIDALADRAADALSKSARTARIHLRERHPLARLGLDIILSAQHEMINTRAYEALQRIPEVASGDWWLARDVRAPGTRDTVHVVAAAGRVAAIQVRRDWLGQLEQADLSATSLLAYAGPEELEIVAIVAAADQQADPGRALAASGHTVAITSTERLVETIVRELDGSPDYDPQTHPRLSCALHNARRRAQQRAAAMTYLACGLDQRRWLLAHGVRLPGLAWPIGVLVAGATGIYVCEAAGIDSQQAATDAINAARHLALVSRGICVQVIPVVLCDPDVDPHQLELGDGRRAWGLPLDRAATLIQQADRAGLRGRQLRRLRRPAPGWEYRIAANDNGWAYEIRYDLSRHERPFAHGG
jgi:hypothetical protein